MPYPLLALVVFLLATSSDVLSIVWRHFVDGNSSHRAALTSAVMCAIGLVDVVVIVHDWTLIAPLFVGEVAGTYVGIAVKKWIKRREDRANGIVEVEIPEARVVRLRGDSRAA